MTKEISNTEDIIDSRDIIARIEELEEDESRDESEEEELKILKELAEEGESSFSDWEHGIGLIRDSYFEDYARSLAEDIGAIKADMDWPCNCIDWKQAAEELQQDYTSIEFDGVTYWGR